MSIELLQAPPTTVVYTSGEIGQLTSGLDLILPCWNPSGSWVESLIGHYYEIIHLMKDTPVQLILVNDGSTRGFEQAKIEYLKSAIPDIQIVSYKQNRGKGYAVREGVKNSKYAFQVCTDLDFPFGVHAVKGVYERLLMGVDIVAGERGEAYLNKLPPKRKRITQISRFLNKMVLQLKVEDAQAGLKGFNVYGRNVMLETNINGFLYDSEFMYNAGKRSHLKIGAVSVACRSDIQFSTFRTKLLLKEMMNYCKLVWGAYVA
ncbi:glycosyltransferase [Chitinophaga silvatica]|uniref:Glycosyltransferase n=1 Tax=Chitinophaga silvatica TaxID=2282649 RepID=A0A3E1Y7A8_9BACT|nr:glycosyltransferase [Chitinophaga silvatica]RFS20913.1 glycosyltransferase [Chitinophaga silvatica]